MPALVITTAPVSRIADLIRAWRMRQLRKAIERLESDIDYMERSAKVFRSQAEAKRVQLARMS